MLVVRLVQVDSGIWIHIDDLTRAILHTINTEDAHGVFNFTAPIVEHQNLFGYTLARISHRPHYTWYHQ